eukprot:2425640-Pleurochrysis_carterae.AAC.1
MGRPSRRRRHPRPSDRPSYRQTRGLRGGATTEVSPPAHSNARRPPPRAARSPGHLVWYVAVGGVGIAVGTT